MHTHYSVLLNIVTGQMNARNNGMNGWSWHDKHTSTAMNQHTTTEELLEIMFSMLLALWPPAELESVIANEQLVD
jgi:hypothetical protein